MDEAEVEKWFVCDVLPLRGMVERFLRRNWKPDADVPDLLQETWVRVYEAGRNGFPVATKPFVFATARNLLIDRLRQKSIVSIENVADLERCNVPTEDASPERHVAARQELQRLQAVLDRLPAKCREVIILRKVEGLSQRQCAAQLGLTEDAVEHHVANGISFLRRGMASQKADIVAQSRRHRLRIGFTR